MTTLFLDTSFSRTDISVNPVQLLTFCFSHFCTTVQLNSKQLFLLCVLYRLFKCYSIIFLLQDLQHLTSIVKVSTTLCFVLATVPGGSWVPKCQAWTAIPLTLWDISERQGRCYSEAVVFYFLGSNRTGFVETKCRFNFLIARRTFSSLLGGLHF